MTTLEKYKILVVGSFGESAGAGPSDESKIVEAFKDLGHTVDAIPRETLLDALGGKEMVGNDLVILFNYPYPWGAIQKVRAVCKCPIYYWTSDLMRGRSENWYPVKYTPELTEDKGFADMVANADLVLGDEYSATPYWASKGVKYFYFPYKANLPRLFHPIPGEEKIYDVVFTGSGYPHGGRDVLMQKIQEKFDLHIFSSDPVSWSRNVGIKEDHCHPGAFDEEFSKVMAKTKISIGISWNYQFTGSWSDRTVKSMLAGVFHLVKYIPFMEREYQDGVAYFNTFEDCLEKIEYYLKHEDEREKIAKRGYEIAMDRHTLHARLNQLLIYFKYQGGQTILDTNLK